MDMKLAYPFLKGQVALVTGASSGIGKGIAMALAQAGAHVAVNYHTEEERAKEVVEAIRKLGNRSCAIQANVSNEAEVKHLFQEATRQLGTLDILINNSGIQKDAPIDEMTLEQWNLVIGTNLTGAFLCAREAIRLFKSKTALSLRTRGKIVFISSVHDIIPWANHANYAASKGGLKLFMQTVAQEVAPLRIRVNSVCPGAIRTPINKQAWETPEAMENLLNLIPYKRIGEVEDVSKLVVWLASDEADYITGTQIYVDGGMTLYPGFASGG